MLPSPKGCKRESCHGRAACRDIGEKGGRPDKIPPNGRKQWVEECRIKRFSTHC